MVQTYPISKTITPLADLEERFNLTPTQNDQFFTEWYQNLPELTSQELATLEAIKKRFERHRKRGSLAEGVIDQLLISPLLTLAGLYDDPFYVTTESSVTLEIEDRDEILKGRIDTLVIAQKFWILVVKSKATIAFSVALPQVMTYMMSNPNPQYPVYGLITNGDEFMFIKMLTEETPQYDFSNIFSLLIPRRNQLQDILQILKRIVTFINQ